MWVKQRNKDKKIKNKNNSFSEEHYIFIRNSIEYLSKNIGQNISKNANTKKNIFNHFPTQSPKIFQN